MKMKVLLLDGTSIVHRGNQVNEERELSKSCLYSNRVTWYHIFAKHSKHISIEWIHLLMEDDILMENCFLRTLWKTALHTICGKWYFLSILYNTVENNFPQILWKTWIHCSVCRLILQKTWVLQQYLWKASFWWNLVFQEQMNSLIILIL